MNGQGEDYTRCGSDVAGVTDRTRRSSGPYASPCVTTRPLTRLRR